MKISCYYSGFHMSASKNGSLKYIQNSGFGCTESTENRYSVTGQARGHGDYLNNLDLVGTAVAQPQTYAIKGIPSTYSDNK